MSFKKWRHPIPEPGSARDFFLRFFTGLTVLPFGAVWIRPLKGPGPFATQSHKGSRTLQDNFRKQ